MKYTEVLLGLRDVLMARDLSASSEKLKESLSKVVKEAYNVKSLISKSNFGDSIEVLNGKIALSKDYLFNFDKVKNMCSKEGKVKSSINDYEFKMSVLKLMSANSGHISLRDVEDLIRHYRIYEFKYFIQNVKKKRGLLRAYYNKLNTDYRIVKVYFQRKYGLPAYEKKFYEKLVKLCTEGKVDLAELNDLYIQLFKLLAVSIFLIQEIDSDSFTLSNKEYTQLYDKLQTVSELHIDDLILKELGLNKAFKDLKFKQSNDVIDDMRLLGVKFVYLNHDKIRELIKLAKTRYKVVSAGHYY